MQTSLIEILDSIALDAVQQPKYKVTGQELVQVQCESFEKQQDFWDEYDNEVAPAWEVEEPQEEF